MRSAGSIGEHIKEHAVLGTFYTTGQIIANYVPYTGANANVDLGSYNFTTADYISSKNFTNSYHYTGFPNRDDTSLSWDDGTYTVTLTASDDKIWIDGVEYNIDTLTSAVTEITTGLYWFWITAPGGVPQLNNSTTEINIGDGGANAGFDQCLVAIVYWNTATNKGLMADERHWFGRDAWMHEYLHETVGARFYDGMAGTFDNTTLTVEAGEFYDEDIEHINAQETVATVLYKNGDANWAWNAASTTPYKVVNPGIDDTLQYNNGNALASVGNAQFVNNWVYITNDANEPVKIVIGQATYGTIAGARTEDPSTLSLGVLPSPEFKLIYKITYKNVNGTPTYQETTDFRAVSTLPTGTYIPTQHSTLAGLTTGDDHPQYVLNDGEATNITNGTFDLTTTGTGTFGGTSSGQSTIDSGLVVNEAGGNAAADDFRVETANEGNALVVDASADQLLVNVDLISTDKITTVDFAAAPVDPIVIDGAGLASGEDIITLIRGAGTNRFVLRKSDSSVIAFLECGGTIGLFGTSTNSPMHIRQNYEDAMVFQIDGDIEIHLRDNAGADKLEILDLANAVVASIDSNGNADFTSGNLTTTGSVNITKINDATLQDIDIFANTADTGDATDGSSLRVWRVAAEHTRSFEMLVDQFGQGKLLSTGPIYTYANGNSWFQATGDTRFTANSNVNFDAGANYLFRDKDDGYATRASMSSATGNWDFTSGNLTTTGTVTQGGTVFTPSTAQVIDAVGDTILANATMIVLNPDADRTLTSTPTIANGTTGQILYITCANGEANTVTVQDQGTLASSNLQLGGATRIIAAKSVLTLIFDGVNWVECSYQIS